MTSQQAGPSKDHDDHGFQYQISLWKNNTSEDEDQYDSDSYLVVHT